VLRAARDRDLQASSWGVFGSLKERNVLPSVAREWRARCRERPLESCMKKIAIAALGFGIEPQHGDDVMGARYRWRRGRCGRRCCCGNWLRWRRCRQQSWRERQQEWPGWRYDRQQGAWSGVGNHKWQRIDPPARCERSPQASSPRLFRPNAQRESMSAPQETST
jgi:hypothetical protein